MTSKKSMSSGKGAGRAKKTTPVNTSGGNGHAETGVEDRSGRRVPIQLLVDYKSDGNYLFDFCKDLGTGGVFIQTTKPLPTGSAIDLTFTIPDSKETLITKGTVIWVQSPVAERKDLVPGMGVQFKTFSVEQRRLLEDFVQRYHGTRLTTTTPVPPKAGKRAG